MTEKEEINPFESPQEEQLLNSGSEHDRLSAETWIMVITPVAIGSLAFSTVLALVDQRLERYPLLPYKFRLY